MFIYRLSLTEYAGELTGEGSRLFGGRWNKAGTRCLYTAESRALSVLESLVNDTISTTPKKLSIITLKAPDENHLIIKPAQLPENWNKAEVSEHTQSFGSALLDKAGYLIIRVPSVVIPQEYNYIINPVHPDMKKVSIIDVSDFSFDTRLKK